MKKLQLTVLAAILVAASRANALTGSITYSGTGGLYGLDTLTYTADTPGASASYVAGTPAVAHLYTPDSGTTVNNGNAEVARVAAFGNFGTLSNFSASYTLASTATGPAGTSPYFVIFVSPTADTNTGDDYALISFDGPNLNASTLMHAYGPGFSGLPDNGYFGYSLATLNGITDPGNGNTTAFGDMTVDAVRVEIGEWNNGDTVIPATADIDSITLNSVTEAPEPSTYVTAAMGFGMLVGIQRLRRRSKQLQASSNPH